MKIFLKFGLLTFFLSLSSGLFSQNFISENKTWNITVKTGFDEHITTRTLSFKFSGDTTIQQKSYKKLYESDDEQKQNWALNSFWFERNDSVFRRGAWYTGDILVYDFTLSEKDSFTVIENDLYLYVDSIRTKEWGGKEREFIYLHPSEWYLYMGTQTIWIKGVGQLGYMPRSTEIGITGGACSLLCFEEDGELVYQNPEYNSCYVVTSVPTLKKELELIEVYSIEENLITVNSLTGNPGIIQIFDISGNQIIQEDIESNESQICLPTNGAYIYRFISNTGEIQNGKVVVW